MQERLTMSEQEVDRLKVIHEALKKHLSWMEAAEQLRLSERQVGRLCARVRNEGNRGICHRLRGRTSNHQLPEGALDQALKLVKQHYPDFGPTFANEKLRDRHRVVISTETLRQGMIQAGLWKTKHRKTPHRLWRPRRSCVGELVQLDGSDHAWFEGRAPRCVLLIYIDDATSRILYGQFVAVEDTLTLLRSTQAYLRRHGRPVAFYVDKDSIYRVNRQATIEEQLQDSAPLTQFSRAMSELGVEVIPAHSPQAKGRVERSFDTHQDRLVKELRLAGISEAAAANQFLLQHYIPSHNMRFALEPANPTNAHRPLLKHHRLESILSVQTQRQVGLDYTVGLNKRFFQILPKQPVSVRPKSTVLIEQRLDGTLHLRFKGRYLAFKHIPKLPTRQPLITTLPTVRCSKPIALHRPPMNHPLKAASFQAMLRRKTTQTHATQIHDSSI
jgi:hypothetical protein